MKVSNPHDELPVKTAKYVKECVELFLGDRGIEKIENFEDFVNVQVLWLNGNKIRKIKNLDSNFRIQKLYVQDNQICSLKGSLKTFRFLNELRISGNQIHNLDEALQTLSKFQHLEVLDLFDNPCALEGGYRERVIKAIPSLQILDRQVVTQKEREKANQSRSKSPSAPKKNTEVRRPKHPDVSESCTTKTDDNGNNKHNGQNTPDNNLHSSENGLDAQKTESNTSNATEQPGQQRNLVPRFHRDDKDRISFRRPWDQTQQTKLGKKELRPLRDQLIFLSKQQICSHSSLLTDKGLQRKISNSTGEDQRTPKGSDCKKGSSANKSDTSNKSDNSDSGNIGCKDLLQAIEEMEQWGWTVNTEDKSKLVSSVFASLAQGDDGDVDPLAVRANWEKVYEAISSDTSSLVIYWIPVTQERATELSEKCSNEAKRIQDELSLTPESNKEQILAIQTRALEFSQKSLRLQRIAVSSSSRTSTRSSSTTTALSPHSSVLTSQNHMTGESYRRNDYYLFSNWKTKSDRFQQYRQQNKNKAAQLQTSADMIRKAKCRNQNKARSIQSTSQNFRGKVESAWRDSRSAPTGIQRYAMRL